MRAIRVRSLPSWIAIVACLALLLAACSGGGEAETAASDDDLAPAADAASEGAAATTEPSGSSDAGEATDASSDSQVGPIAVVIKGLDNPFFQFMEEGINDQAAATAADVTIQAAESIEDTAGQADRLSALANQDFACYVVNPISGTNLIQGISQIAAKGVPIVNIDNPVEAEAAEAADATIATYIGTDNIAAGSMVADQLAEIAPEGGDVVTVGGIPGDVTSAARIEGFTDGLSEDFEVVQEVAANWDRQEAQTQAETVLQARPDLAAFFVANDDMAYGVARAVAAADQTGEVKVVSVDGIDGVASGEIDAAVAQYPYVVGKMGLEACQAAAQGATLPEQVDTPIALITPDNAEAAQEAFPEPPEDYDDPFADLLGN